MIVRSQNKKLIVNFDNVSEVCIRDNSIGVGAIAGGVNFIGTYSTEEKAIKVLDMIQNAYERHTMFSITYQDGILAELEKRNGFDTARDLVSPIFNMPSDESVEV